MVTEYSLKIKHFKQSVRLKYIGATTEDIAHKYEKQTTTLTTSTGIVYTLLGYAMSAANCIQFHTL